MEVGPQPAGGGRRRHAAPRTPRPHPRDDVVAPRRRRQRPGAARHHRRARRRPTARPAGPGSTSPPPARSWRCSASPGTCPTCAHGSAGSWSARPATGRRSRPEDLGAAGAWPPCCARRPSRACSAPPRGRPCCCTAAPSGTCPTGTCSVIADRVALASADVVVTEAGFGADLGAEKFLHLKVPLVGRAPDVAVVVVTVRAMRWHGGAAADALDARISPRSRRAPRTCATTSSDWWGVACPWWSPSTSTRASGTTSSTRSPRRPATPGPPPRSATARTRTAARARSHSRTRSSAWPPGSSRRWCGPDVEVARRASSSARGSGTAPGRVAWSPEAESTTGLARGARVRPPAGVRGQGPPVRLARPHAAGRPARLHVPGARAAPGGGRRVRDRSGRATCSRCRGCPSTRGSSTWTSTRTGRSSGWCDHR